VTRRNDWIYATPAQETYLRRLFATASALRVAPYAMPNRRLLKSEASRDIDVLKRAIAGKEATR
jgi:hypothetical protein